MTLEDIKRINHILAQLDGYKESLDEVDKLTRINMEYDGYGATFNFTTDKEVISEMKRVLKKCLAGRIHKAEAELARLRSEGES